MYHYLTLSYVYIRWHGTCGSRYGYCEALNYIITKNILISYRITTVYRGLSFISYTKICYAVVLILVLENCILHLIEAEELLFIVVNMKEAYQIPNNREIKLYSE